MARRHTDGEVDTLRLSFLDLISCGLGAAILLSLVYSLVGESPAVDTTAPRFLDVTFVVEDTNSIMNVYLRPPGPDAKGIFIDLMELDVPTGRMSPVFCSTIPLANKVTLVGFSRFGEQLLTATGLPPRQYLNVSIADPAPGDWTVEVLFRDRRDWNAGPEKAVVSRRVVMRHKAPDELGAQEVAFGQLTDFGSKLPLGKIDVEPR